MRGEKSVKYIVIDLEWNQAISKEQSESGMPFEIIEIGAVKLDENMHIVSQFNSLIKPKVYRKLHHKTQEVTRLSIKELNQNGREFKKCIREFFKWCGEDYIFCTWGSMDLTELQRNIRFYGLEIPFARPLLYYDLQKLYSVLYKGGTGMLALDNAVKERNISQRRPFHRAQDDAYYTALVMREMDMESVKGQFSVDFYRPPQKSGEEVLIQRDNEIEFVSRIYDTKEELLKDRTVTCMECWYCKKRLRKKIHWFSWNGKPYFALAYCPEHGYLRGRIKLRKSEDEKVFAVKTLHFTDEQGAEEIREKQKDMYRKRRKKQRLWAKQQALEANKVLEEDQ